MHRLQPELAVQFQLDEAAAAVPRWIAIAASIDADLQLLVVVARVHALPGVKQPLIYFYNHKCVYISSERAHSGDEYTLSCNKEGNS